MVEGTRVVIGLANGWADGSKAVFIHGKDAGTCVCMNVSMHGRMYVCTYVCMYANVCM